jgi:hypothetical protein
MALPDDGLSARLQAKKSFRQLKLDRLAAPH